MGAEWYYVDIPTREMAEAIQVSLKFAGAFNRCAQGQSFAAEISEPAKTYGNDVVALIRVDDIRTGADEVIDTIKEATVKPFYLAKWKAVQGNPNISQAIRDFGLSFE